MSALDPFRKLFAEKMAEGLDPEAIAAIFGDGELLQLLELAEADRDQERFGKFQNIFPDETTRVGESIYYARDLYQKNLEFFRVGAKYRERCAMAANRVGKAARNGTPVATPHGWRAIETLKVGEEVIAGDGSICRVTGVFPQGVKPLYRLTFGGGEQIDCCPEHLWKYQHPRARFPYRQSHGKKENNPFFGEWVVADTAAIIDQVGLEPGPRMRVVMPASGAWRLPARKVPLDPYLLGVLIGDGCTIYSAAFSSADQFIVDEVARLCPPTVSVVHRSAYDYSIARKRGTAKSNAVISALREVGIFGCGAGGKFVPEDYLLNSPDARLAMLQGLMDTDGHITSTGAMEFSTISRRLADDLIFLVQSLGGKARIEVRKGDFRVKVRINVCPFRLPRKAERWNARHNRPDHVLHKIEKAEPGEATCISVDHPDRTFVTAHGIVTHNTFGMGGYEMACHLTGRYPKWWEGRRFRSPIRAWACGKTNETTRDIVQTVLLGDITFSGPRKIVDGSGMIPRECIRLGQGDITWKQGVADLVDTVKIAHISGGYSKLGLKSYQQGRGAFEGTAIHVCWDDEEPPLDVWGEQLMRLATTKGIMMLTFTPLEGLSEVVLQFLPAEMRPAIV
jgi:phage terminase large subunit-like protein